MGSEQAVEVTSSPRPAPGSGWLEIDDEVLALDAAATKVHLIGGSGARLTPLLDGTVSIAELAADVEAAFEISHELAISEVLGLASHLVGAGVLVLSEEEPEPVPIQPAAGSGPQYLTRPQVACRDGWADPAWIGSLAVKVGQHHVGLASDDALVLDQLRAAYAPHLIDDPAVVDDFGLSVPPPSRGAPRPIPFLTRGPRRELRSRCVNRLLRLLDVNLALILGGQQRTGSLGLRETAAVVRGARAVLLPDRLVRRSSGVERAMRARGLQLIDAPGLRLRPGEVLVEGPSGLAGPDSLAAWDDQLLAGPGTYDLVAIAWPSQELLPDERDSLALVRLVRAVSDLGGATASEALESLAGLRRLFVRRDGITGSPAVVVATLEELLSTS